MDIKKLVLGLLIGKLNKEALIKIAKGAVIAGLGAGAVYGIEGLTTLDWGIWAPAATAIASVLVNLIRKRIGK